MLKLFCIIGRDWFGLVLCSVCKKGKCLKLLVTAPSSLWGKDSV